MLITLIIILGLCLGSFATCLTYRSKYHYSLLYPHSFCETCQHNLTWWQLIPVLGYVLQKGHCHFCHQKISPFSTYIELGFALLLGSVCYFLPWEIWPNFILTSFWLLCLSLEDWQDTTISLYLLVLGAIGPLTLAPLQLSFTQVVLLGVLLWENWTKKLGYGDTFVILVLGITLGDQTLASILFIASLAALIYVKYTKQHALPFVPFLSLGYLLSLPVALNWAKF